MVHATWMDGGIEPLGVRLSIVDGEAIAVVAGELDVFSAADLREALREAAASQVDRVVMDAAGVSFIDVLGLNVLVGMAAECRGRGMSFVLRNPSDEVLRIQELIGAEDSAIPIES